MRQSGDLRLLTKRQTRRMIERRKVYVSHRTSVCWQRSIDPGQKDEAETRRKKGRASPMGSRCVNCSVCYGSQDRRCLRLLVDLAFLAVPGVSSSRRIEFGAGDRGRCSVSLPGRERSPAPPTRLEPMPKSRGPALSRSSSEWKLSAREGKETFGSRKVVSSG